MSALAPVLPNETPAYITTVGDDGLIRVPRSIPSGATVAVVVIGSGAEAERERNDRFAKVLTAIRNAIAHGYDDASAPSIEEIAALVKKARAARRNGA